MKLAPCDKSGESEVGVGKEVGSPKHTNPASWDVT